MIKKILLTIAIVMFMGGLAIAETTEGTAWTTPSSSLNSALNQYGTHNHQYDDYDMPMGIGADVTIYEFNENVSVKGEGKYDFNNESASVFGVVDINLFRILSGE